MRKERNRIALGVAVLLTSMLGAEARSQDDRLWVLNEGRYDYTAGVLETPPSLGVISGETWSYEEVLSFPSSNFSTDLKIKGDMAYATYQSKKQIGDGPPMMVRHTDIFVRENKNWLLTHSHRSILQGE